MGVRAVIFREEMSKYVFNMTAGVFGRILLLGGVAGLATWLLGLAVNRYMLQPFFCGAEESVSICLNSTVISSNVAAVLVAIMIVPLLAMVSMKRALVIVVAATAALWSVAAWVAGPWLSSLLWTILSYIAVYGAVAWINRLRGDLAAILFLTAFVVLARLVLSI